MRSAVAEEIDAHFASGRFDALIDAAARDPDGVMNDAAAAFQLGLAYASAGALGAAAAPLRRALELRPGDAAIMGALARVLILLGEKSAAEETLGMLAARAGADPAAALHLTDAFLQAERAEEAFTTIEAAAQKFAAPQLDVRLSEAAIRTRRNEIAVAAAKRAHAKLGLSPPVINIAGAAALLAGDEEWLKSVLAAVDAAPAAHAAAIFDFWTAMLMAGDHLSAALQSATLSAARAPTAPRWRFVADLRLAARDVAGAEEAAGEATRLAPDDAAAIVLLARCRLVEGEIDAARKLLLQAIEIDPECAVAFDYLTQLDARAMTADMAARLEARIERPCRPDERSKALLALARRDEAHGEHERALNRFIAAKAIIADSARARGAGYRPETVDAAVARFERLFAAPVDLNGADRAAPSLIFIVGMPRSGTSLAEQILSAHPAVVGGGELPEMINIMNEVAAGASTADAARRLLDERREAFIARYRSGLPAIPDGTQAASDKHPLNFWSVGVIKALFPDAKIVHAKRAPIDACLSILRVRFFADYAFANEIDAVAHYYAAYERMMGHWRAVFGNAIFDFDYESLVAGPESQTRRLLDYCGLEWSDRCLDFHKTKRDVITHSAAQVREPINARAMERRKHYGAALKPLEEALARFGVHVKA
ncbi:MAG: sulfotransferase [Parvularculaceae bacterium]